MKRNGFTLLELLIGISLISIVMIFLFRLLNDIQHEALSNTYIVANQTNRNEMINVLDTILYENGDVCNLYIGSSATNRLYKIGFCNNANNEISITISKRAVKIEYNSIKYNYEMRDSNGYYEIALPYTISSFNGKKYIRFNIVTHKKGLRETIIDDIEIMGTVQNLKVKKENVDEFAYTGAEQEFVVPKTGRYKIELWGAQGGNYNDSTTYIGGYGAYTSGTIQLTKDDILYLYVGGQPSNSSTSVGGYNGGGICSTQKDTDGRTGGGATDIRLLNGNWDNAESLASRIMVAGGGGGASYESGSWYSNGGTAGGLHGLIASDMSSNASTYFGTGGTQVAGGTPNAITAYADKIDSSVDPNGSFGQGGGGSSKDGGAGGGGGYYGGAGTAYLSGGGGGSSYISGYTGCVAVTSVTNTTPRNDSDGEECTEESAQFDSVCSEHYSGKIFTNAVMKAGNELMPTVDGESTMIGNEGNGFAKITYLGT